jgi:L-fuculokinase
MRIFRDDLLTPMELDTSIFPAVTEPGSIIGKVTRQAAEKMGMKAGIAVIASGHDTQFALLASGAVVNQPVLSSGTWEILMVRSNTEVLKLPKMNSGVTIELDAVPGLVNPGIQWVASGVLEWIGRLFYSEVPANDILYRTMMQEAALIGAGSQGITMIPELFPGGFSGKPGSITGFSHETTRAHFYRAALEALSYYLAFSLDKLQQVGNYTAGDLICVGGGSKNPLWNQIRADVTGIPVKAFDMRETTALGASLMAMTGLNIFKNVEEAFHAAQYSYLEFEPGENTDRYGELYDKYIERVLKTSPSPLQ